MLPALKDYKRVIVTGGGGVLGTALSQLIANGSGLQVLAPSRKDLDLLNSSDVSSYFQHFKPDLVLHLAGKVFGVKGNLDFGGQSYYENSLINLNVIEASRLAGVKKVVAAGTAAIYSDIVPLPMSEDDLWLGAPHGSEGPYGHSKRGMLAQLEAYKQQYNIDFAYLILTNLYGPNDKFDELYGHVVPALISRFEAAARENKEEVVCWGDGSPTRDFLYSADAARAFLFSAAYGHGAMNVATGDAIPIKTLVNEIARKVGFQGRIEWDITKPLGQKERSYNVERIKSTGWLPEHNIEQGLSKTIDWYKKNAESVRR